MSYKMLGGGGLGGYLSVIFVLLGGWGTLGCKRLCSAHAFSHYRIMHRELCFKLDFVGIRPLSQFTRGDMSSSLSLGGDIHLFSSLIMSLFLVDLVL